MCLYIYKFSIKQNVFNVIQILNVWVSIYIQVHATITPVSLDVYCANTFSFSIHGRIILIPKNSVT